MCRQVQSRACDFSECVVDIGTMALVGTLRRGPYHAVKMRSVIQVPQFTHGRQNVVMARSQSVRNLISAVVFVH